MSTDDSTPDGPSFPVDRLPQELRELDQWLCWDDASSEEEFLSPTTQEPLGKTGEAATFREAKQTVNKSTSETVAFQLSEEDNYLAIRLENCATAVEDGVETTEWADDVMEKFDSYTEVGPKRKTITILTEATLPQEEFVSDRLQFVSKGAVPLTGWLDADLPTIQPQQEAVEDLFREYNEHEPSEEQDAAETEEAETDSPDYEDVSLDDVREIVVEKFDSEMWHLTEALLSAHATLLIERVKNCTGFIVVGPSGTGKTTALRFFEGLEEQVYRTDSATNASIVSHDASLTEEELSDVDLLPRMKHKTVTWRDMSTFFSGEKATIRERMSLMADVMDGDGFSKDSGSHGRRGYRGDYRFTFLGASTPLSPRAWEVMGHTGFRFVFYHLNAEENDFEQALDELSEGILDKTGESEEYHEKVEACRNRVHDFLRGLWDEHGGAKAVDADFSLTEEAVQSLAKLAWIVKFSRAPLREDDEPAREGEKRVTAILRDIARGRALLEGRTEIDVDDVMVSARISLSTMPRKRRPIIQALFDPANDGTLTTSEVVDLGPSRPTAIERMKLIDTLGIAEFVEDEDDGRQPKRLELNPEFEWPDCLDFPEF